MKKISVSSASICGFVALCCFYGAVNAVYVKYNTTGAVVPGKLNVHLVPHSHDDVGWLKTFDQYYVGANNSIQGACVQNILDSVVVALRRNPDRKFNFAEMAFFYRWWFEQGPEVREQVRKLVDSGQLEFVNGGWCMHDEGATHYIDMVDQTTLGHQLIKKYFNKAPRAGWQIDTFGHSAAQGYLFGAELGFDSVHFGRMDYQDRIKRKADKALEAIWHGSKTFGSSSQIFANAFPHSYTAPKGFANSIPVQDDPLVSDYNVEQRVKDFIDVAMTQANWTRGNHIMWTMGDDFKYQYAESWFRQMDKLIHYVNKDGRVNALYSTPSIYTDAKNGANESWPLKTDDYFPYADGRDSYWTGYFSSRPNFKRYVRILSGYYLAARQLEFLVGRKSSGPNTFSLGDALGIAQHHDAISGTDQQHVSNDYKKRLAKGATEAEAVVNSALSYLANNASRNQSGAPVLAFSQCPLLNISYCPSTENVIPGGKSLVVVAYNSLAWNRTDLIRVPVNDTNLVVRDSSGNIIETQYVGLDISTRILRNLYTKAYLGHSPNEAPRYWLLFQGSVPALGWNTYFISKAEEKGKRRVGIFSATDSSQNETVEIGNGRLKMLYSLSLGQLTRMYNNRTGVDVPIQQSYFWYGSSNHSKNSNAYVFRTRHPRPNNFSTSVDLKVIRGPLVDEVHQKFNSWIYQITRLYKDKEHAEVEFTIGPIPSDNGDGKEVITRMTSNMATNKVFYTDSNGRDFLKRVRNYREDWPLKVTAPVAGNYYPINLGIYTTDNKTEFSILVDSATGGSSINDGEVELMLHRRLTSSLRETVCVESKCEGLTIRGKYYTSINRAGEGARWRRTVGQEVYSPLVLAFTHEKMENWVASHSTKATSMVPGYTLPPNVALITLQEVEDKSVLLRLAHLYEEGEDREYSTMARVELKNMFDGKTVKMVQEVSLSTNQVKSEMKKMKWKVEGDNGSGPAPVRGGPVKNSTLVVELGPMEIRSFLLKF